MFACVRPGRMEHPFCKQKSCRFHPQLMVLSWQVLGKRCLCHEMWRASASQSRRTCSFHIPLIPPFPIPHFTWNLKSIRHETSKPLIFNIPTGKVCICHTSTWKTAHYLAWTGRILAPSLLATHFFFQSNWSQRAIRGAPSSTVPHHCGMQEGETPKYHNFERHFVVGSESDALHNLLGFVHLFLFFKEFLQRISKLWKLIMMKNHKL